MVEVPDRLMAERVITEAREYGNFDIPTTIGLGQYGQYDADLEYSLSDLEAESCEVEMCDTSIVVHGEIEGEYSTKVSNRTRHHPAEYEHHTVPIFVTIEMDLEHLSELTVRGEIA